MLEKIKQLDIKKIIILLGTIVILIIGYFVISSFFNQDTTQSTNNLGTFLPFNNEGGGGSYSGGNNPTNTGDNPYNNDPSANPIPVLRHITDIPVAGAIIFKAIATSTDYQENSEEEFNSLIRFIEKATGHIYETGTNSLTQTRISNTTIPKIQEAVWLDNSSLIIRYLGEDNSIKTFSAELTTNDLGDQELTGTFLQDNLQEIIKFGKKIFYLLESGKGLIGVISDKDDKNKEIVFESPLKEWLITNIDNKYINFTTKPAITTEGFSFILDTKTGNFNKTMGGKMNLSTLINSSFDILYSEYDKSGPKLSTYKNQITTTIPFKTFPEKCVWDNENIYIYCGIPTEELSNYDLTKWYQGIISFSDDIWKINTETGATELLISPTDLEIGEIDIINPTLNEDGSYFLFTNKKDYSLWGLKLRKDLY